MINVVVVEGRLVKNAELRYLDNGRNMLKFRIANNIPFRRNNEWQENTSFFDVVVYGNDLKYLLEKLNKGTLVLVEGKLNQNVWEKEGNKISSVNIIAKRVSVIKQPSESVSGEEVEDIEI